MDDDKTKNDAASEAGFDRTSLFEHRRPYMVDSLVNISLRRKYVFVEVAKVACTTIKYNLQKLEFLGSDYARPRHSHEVHDRWTSPFIMPMQLDDETLARALRGDEFFRFTFVRNPYTRILSAYLDKFGKNAPQKAPVLAALGKDPADLSQHVSFGEFLASLKLIPVREMDVHFIPQWVSNFAGKFEHGFIGSFELFEDDFRSVYERIAPKWFYNQLKLENEGGHATDTTAQIAQYFGDEERGLALDLFARDFELFGYSTDIADASKPPIGREKPVVEIDETKSGEEGLAAPTTDESAANE